MTTPEIPSEPELAKQVPQFSFLDTLADELAGSACSVFGSPVERDGVTVIPVATARWGMGGGYGPPRDANETSRPERRIGGGGGAKIKPLGFIELANGRSRFRSIRDPGLYPLAAIASGLFGFSAMRFLARSQRKKALASFRFGKRRTRRRLLAFLARA